MVEYRPIPEGRTDELRRFLSYAFRPSAGPPEPDDELPVPAQVGEARGLFEGDDLRSVCKHLWLSARVRGEFRSTAGLTAVATPPEHRREGLVRELVQSSLGEYRDREVELAALWPFDHPFYAQFGWALANTYAVHECPPEALSMDRGGGDLIRLKPDDYGRLDPIYRAHGADYELTLDRTPEWWRKRVFAGWQTDPYVYGVERDGDLRGYAVYQVEDGDETRLRVVEMAYADHAARRDLLGLLADHDSQVATVRLYGPPETSLLDLVEDPDEVETRIRPGPMVRLVDVAGALEGVVFPDSGRFVLDVEDPVAPWNDGAFAVEIEAGEVTVADSDEDPDVSIGIGALSQGYVGYRSIDDLETTGRCAIYTRAARELLRGTFPERQPFLREGF